MISTEYINVRYNVVDCVDIFALRPMCVIHSKWQCLINVPYRFIYRLSRCFWCILNMVFLSINDRYTICIHFFLILLNVKSSIKWTKSPKKSQKNNRNVSRFQIIMSWVWSGMSELYWSLFDTGFWHNDNKFDDDETKMIIVCKWHDFLWRSSLSVSQR